MGHVLHINNNVAYNDESIVIQIGKQKTETGDSQQAGKQGNVKVKNKCFWQNHRGNNQKHSEIHNVELAKSCKIWAVWQSLNEYNEEQVLVSRMVSGSIAMD